MSIINGFILDVTFLSPKRKEINTLMQKSVPQAVMYGFPYQLVGSLISLMFLLQSGYKLTPQNIFTTTALLNVVGRVFYTNFVYGIDFGSRSWDALNRVEEFLLTDLDIGIDEDKGKRHTDSNEKSERGVTSVSLHDKLWAKYPPCNDLTPKTVGMDPLTGNLSAIHVNISGLSCKQNENPAFLHDISLSLRSNQLVAVTGPVGCGKSSLLQAILGELPITSGQISGRGGIAYVPQHAWLFSGTVRDNILFGRPFDEEWYDKTVRACALRKDFDLLPAGDLTHIGERGASLSGGQRARVSLARAVYINADIYLLDDPLSGVDPQVSQQIFEECILGILQKCPRIFVTHSPRQLKEAHHVLIITGGIIANQGKYNELLQSSEYIKFLESSTKTESTTVNESVVSDTVLLAHPFDPVISESNQGLETLDEDRSTGTVSLTTYWKFFRLGAAPVFLMGLIVLLVLPDGK